MEKKEGEETAAAATADAHLISEVIVMSGDERTVCWCRGWLSLS